jgi:hypothetical protein
LKQSSAVHIQASYSVDGILPGGSSKHRLLVINLASVPGGQLDNTPTQKPLPLPVIAFDHPATLKRNHFAYI